VEASQKDWLGGRQFDVGRYLHGATLEETAATGVYCLVTGKRRDSNVYFVQSGGTWVLVDTAWRGRAELIRSAAETLFGVGARPRAIVLAHVHPDHAGSASELARMWDVTVYVYPDELPLPPSGRITGAMARVERRWMFPPGQDGLSPIDPANSSTVFPHRRALPANGVRRAWRPSTTPRSQSLHSGALPRAEDGDHASDRAVGVRRPVESRGDLVE